MKNFLFALMAICIGYVSFGQKTPVVMERPKFDLSTKVLGADIIITNDTAVYLSISPQYTREDSFLVIVNGVRNVVYAQHGLRGREYYYFQYVLNSDSAMNIVRFESFKPFVERKNPTYKVFLAKYRNTYTQWSIRKKTKMIFGIQNTRVMLGYAKEEPHRDDKITSVRLLTKSQLKQYLKRQARKK